MIWLGVVVVAGLGALTAGCGPSWKDFVSPNYRPQNPDAGTSPDAGTRTSFGAYTLVDGDNDGVYARDNARDVWLKRDGTAVAKDDPALLMALASNGIDGQRLDRAPLPALVRYQQRLAAIMPSFKGAADGNAVWQSYQELATVATEAGIAFDRGSALYAVVMKESGAHGCWIPLGLADIAAQKGDIEATRAGLAAATDCMQQRRVNSEASLARRFATLEKLITVLIEKLKTGPAQTGDLAAFNAGLKELRPHINPPAGERNRLPEERIKRLVESVIAVTKMAYGKALDNICEEEAVRNEATQGKVDLLNQKIGEVKKCADEISFWSEFAATAREKRLETYTIAIMAIQNRDRKAMSTKVARERLAALEQSASELGIYQQLHKQFAEARRTVR